MVPNRISSHLVVKGRKFTKCYYLKKVSEKEEFIKYKQLDRESICITVTILCPAVPFKEDFTVFKWIRVYQWHVITEKYLDVYSFCSSSCKLLIDCFSSSLQTSFKAYFHLLTVLAISILHLSFKNSNSLLQSSYSLLGSELFLQKIFTL